MYTLEKIDSAYDGDTMKHVMGQARYIVQRHRPWFSDLNSRFSLHPIVRAALDLCRPHDWHQLLLEWPHVAESDPNRIAYTRDERAGEADRQTLTTMGKYITRHFPMLPDHYVRDLVARYTRAEDKYLFARDLDNMVYVMQNGPKSCMTWEHADIDAHPYRVYDPIYGWHMAYRVEPDGLICGRALCMDNGKHKFYVRSYNRARDGGYSHADTALETWLKEQGYEHRSSWEGCFIAYIHGNPFFVPYIDGGAQGVTEHVDSGNKRCLRIVDECDAEWLCNGTDGEPEEAGGVCEDCGSRHHDDDAYWVGVHEERRVGPCCIDDYRYAYSRRGNQYYLDESDCVEVDGEWYHINYLSDNGIVEAADGEYYSVDDCVYIDSEDAYYHQDDRRICCDIDGEYRLREDCVEVDGEWYETDDDRIVECDDGVYRLREECFECPSCSTWHARESIEA